jgi:cell division protein FtsL
MSHNDKTIQPTGDSTNADTRQSVNDTTTQQTHDPTTTSRTEQQSTFTKNQKWLLIIIVSTAATFSGAASNIYFPVTISSSDSKVVSGR